jgi:LuxR family transcriptional regulator, maltose regulon positive regulatory protein
MIEAVESPAALRPADDGRALGRGGVVPRLSLFGRLGSSARVTVVSAPAGSGKTVLLRSWIAEAGLAGRAAWVAAACEERDPQRFWLSVSEALRQTGPGTGLVRAVSPAPDVDGWALAEGLLSDLAPLDERLWLVIDDVHELGPDALRQLELLIMRAPPQLRFVLTARHDVRLGLHRLRLEGGLTEIRARDLQFTLAEAGELFTAAGVGLSEPTLVTMHERTEGWAAGLRLAALSLARHPDPARFVAGFSGTDRTVAEYLLAEVLDRQSAAVRRLLLRTSILERVNGELADLLTGDQGGERVLQDLEAAGAFTVALDTARSWFRYHQMFGGLLRLELRRAEPGAVTGLHAAAADWLAAQGFAVEAVRHAQVAEDWELAARLLAGHWPTLHLDGQAATVHDLLTGFPAEASAADAELAVVAAADELAQGSLEAAERYLALAERQSASAPAGREEYGRLLLGVVRLLLDRQRGNLPAVATDVRELQAMAEVADASRPGLGADLRALALISLGSMEYWAAAPDDAARHLESGVALARRIGRPYLEFTGLVQWAAVVVFQSFTRAVELGREAVGLAERHGWTDDPAFGFIASVLAGLLTWQARLEEAEPLLQSAERALGDEAAQPAASASIRFVRGAFEMMRNRDWEALAAFQAADLLARRLDSPHYLIPWIRALLLLAMVRLGQTGPAGQLLAGLSDTDREHGEIRMAEAALRLAQGDPRAATAALAPVLEGSAPLVWQNGRAQAYLLEAIARDALGAADAADRALECALGLAEPDGMLLFFLLHPAEGLLERRARNRTAHAALVAEIRDILTGPGGMGTAGESRPPVSREGLGGIVTPRRPGPLLEPLSASEVRVLRYLPTNLTTPEIARELSVSHNTVRTHIRHVYAKFGTHHRAEAVEFARALGLLAPSRVRPVHGGL